MGYDESATAHIALILQNYVDHTYAGTQNSSGDDQLHLDIACDDAVFRSIRDALVFAVAASEETPEETDVSPTALKEDDPMYSVGFDPLDGSSIIDANFSGINVIFLLLWCSPSSPPPLNCLFPLFLFGGNIILRISFFFASLVTNLLFSWVYLRNLARKGAARTHREGAGRICGFPVRSKNHFNYCAPSQKQRCRPQW